MRGDLIITHRATLAHIVKRYGHGLVVAYCGVTARSDQVTPGPTTMPVCDRCKASEAKALVAP